MRFLIWFVFSLHLHSIWIVSRCSPAQQSLLVVNSKRQRSQIFLWLPPFPISSALTKDLLYLSLDLTEQSIISYESWHSLATKQKRLKSQIQILKVPHFQFPVCWRKICNISHIISPLHIKAQLHQKYEKGRRKCIFQPNNACCLVHKHIY